MKEDLLKIIKHYGIMEQLKYFQSEIFELNEAIIVDNWAHDVFPEKEYKECMEENKFHIAEEIADVEVMLNQFKEYFGISYETILLIMRRKIDRQLERIKNEVKDETNELKENNNE